MSRAVSIDCGTMFFQVAEANASNPNEVLVKTTRNAFVELEVSDDIDDQLKRNNWQYVKDGNHYYVIGEDSLRVANMFPGRVELRRPMQDGVLNKDEEKNTLILSELIKNSIGKNTDPNSVVCACVSSESVDGSMDSVFHRARLTGIFQNLGWKVKIIEEGQAVILSERPVLIEPDGTESPYSGIGLSLGAGRTNCVLAYKGIPIIGMSVARAGDFIDKKVAEATGEPISQITRKKEKSLDFTNFDTNDDVLFALDAYYNEMIKYVFSKFAIKFAKVKSQFEGPLEIVVAGGTSMPKGFCSKVEKVIRELELPFIIKGVRHASDPVNAVVKGCLIQATITQRKLQEGKEV